MYKHCPIIVAVTGFGVLVIGVICTWYAFPKMVENSISEAIALKDGTQAYEMWKKQPFPLKYKLYFFNVSNPDAVQNGENPIVKEIGPYIYDMFIERINVEVNEAEDSIKYMLKKTFFFNQRESGCRNDEDVVTVINAALVGTALQVQAMLPTALSMISEAMPYLYPGVKDVFLRARVKDLLFEGVRLYCQDEAVEFVCSAMKGALPKTVKLAENGQDFLFSMFGYLNATPVGPYEMGRGLKNTTRGELIKFDDEEELSIWGDGGCNMINGSDSGMFYPMKKPVDRIYAFTPDLCRSLYVNFEKEIVEHSIKVYKYVSKPESLAVNKENMCFCAGEEESTCPANGLLDLTPCLRASVMLSYPHFYLADKKLLEYVTGLNPQKELHESFFIIEPKTATPFEGAKRAQMSIELKKMEAFELLVNVSEGVFPILWLDEGVKLPDEYIAMLQNNFKMLDMLDIFKWLLIISGIVIMLSSFILVMYQERLMCFSNTAKVTISDRNASLPHHNVDTTDIHFNSTMMYPGLYPQMENKNVSDGLVRRSNYGNPQPAWNFKL